MKKMILAAAALFTFSTSASAATYITSRSVGSGSLNASFTTNGTIGTLSASDFVSFNVTVSNNGQTYTLTDSNADILILGSAVSATASALLFNFDAAANSLFLVENLPVHAANPFYCLETSGCNIGYVDQETVGPTGSDGNRASASRSGVFAFASVASPAAVPEPATWAMMLIGFGAVGYSMRSRKVGYRAMQTV